MTKPNQTPPTDNQLVEEARNDIKAFETLIERYESKILRYILRISDVGLETAEEILQDVFVKCWKNLNEFDEDLKFSSWIYRIAHNETISHFRKIKSRGQDKQIQYEESFDQADTTNLLNEIDQKISAKTVRTVIQTLPEKHREILVLRFLEDLSYEEISDILKKPVNTVGTMINRAKAAFKSAATDANLTNT